MFDLQNVGTEEQTYTLTCPDCKGEEFSIVVDGQDVTAVCTLCETECALFSEDVQTAN